MLTGMRMDCPGRACRNTVTVGGLAEVVTVRAAAAGTAVRSPTPEGRGEVSRAAWQRQGGMNGGGA